MEQNQKCATGFSGKILVASLFILSGILLLARNMGWMPAEWFSIIVSWQSLLIIIGGYLMASRHIVGGSILILVGAYFLLGHIPGLPDHARMIVFPVALIAVGLLFIFHPRIHRHRLVHFHRPEGKQQNHSEDGFLHSDNSFGSARHVVLDEVFKGAKINVSFAGTVIDLRHTRLAPGETFIDVDCSWGGIEIHAPSNWHIVFKCDSFCGGCDDKRWQNGGVNTESSLIIRGNLLFGGVEVKD